jgi:nucleoside-triphosphate--adenylate kinase
MSYITVVSLILIFSLTEAMPTQEFDGIFNQANAKQKVLFHRLIITGAPGSGKGTISAWMAKDFALKHLAAGDILRNEISAGTKEGKEASNFVNSGQLVPDELVTRLILKSLNTYTNHHVLFDGYPRTVQQAKDLEYATPITAVIDLDVPHEEIIRRVQGRWIHEPSGRVYNTDFAPPKVPGKDDVTGEDLVQRTDDKPEVVKKRLEDYDKRYKAILDYLRPRVLIKTFSGKTSKEIYAKIKPFLEKTIFKE